MRAWLLEYPAAQAGSPALWGVIGGTPAQAGACAGSWLREGHSPPPCVPRAVLFRDTVRVGCHHREMAMPVIEVRLEPPLIQRSADEPTLRERASTN